jgi:CHASE2 domain-containing sensor protein
MKLHLKIWIPGVLSLLAYVIAKGLDQKPGPDVFTQPLLWYWIWGILQIVAAWYTYQLLKIKRRSGSWIALVALFGLIGIIIIYLIPAKKENPSLIQNT